MKTIFITGASSGIGKATAVYFAEKGWNVAATMRFPEKEKELQKYPAIKLFCLDVEKKETITQAVKDALVEFGTIDVLLNNAGYGSTGIFEAADDREIRRQFDVNVFGLMDVTKALLPHFRSQQDGLIMNVTSAGGRVVLPITSLYHATKFAVEGFTESLAFELHSQGIRVKLIEPGVVLTDFSGRSMAFFKDDSLEDYKTYSRDLLEKMKQLSSGGFSPEIVAREIYQAAIDKSNQLRYVIGEDAEEFIALKERDGAEAYFQKVQQMFS